MRRALALSLRILVTGILAYLAIGVAYRIADELAYFPPSATADIPLFWASPSAFLVWFVLLALLWPFSVAEFLDGGPMIAVALFVAMFAVIYGTLAFVVRRRVVRPQPS